MTFSSFPRRKQFLAAIDQLVTGGGLAVTAVCETLAVSRSGFYAWQEEREGVRRDRELTPLIRDIFCRVIGI